MRRRLRAGFTLLEMLLVLVVLGLFASVVTTSLGTGRDALKGLGEDLVTRLLDARVIAMRSGSGATLVVMSEGGVVRTRVEASDERLRERETRLAGVTLFDETVRYGGGATSDEGVLRGVYAASGRTESRRWTLERGGRMVAIEFDPVTGVPALHRAGDRR